MRYSEKPLDSLLPIIYRVHQVTMDDGYRWVLHDHWYDMCDDSHPIEEAKRSYTTERGSFLAAVRRIKALEKGTKPDNKFVWSVALNKNHNKRK